jgi:hypothetical protein
MRLVRRLFVALVSVALVAGLMTYSVRAANVSATAGATVALSGAMSMPGDCDGCPGEERGSMPAACAAFCGSVAVLPLVPVTHSPVPIEVLAVSVEPSETGRTIAPDPHPPKPFRLT